MKKVRTRIAPSPTGPIHVGNLRTALFNYLFAKKHGGEFLLRIEDTDKERFVAGAEKYVIDSLLWCGIVPDDGINSDGTAKYRQSEREYRNFADKLINSGHAYYAFDTKEELDAMRKSLEDAGSSVQGYSFATRMFMKNSFTLSEDDVRNRISSGEPYVIRFNAPANTDVKFMDIVKGEVAFNTNNMDDKVLFKSDGLPTYHLANVVDDHLMGITHVIRGDEWLSSTPLHILLYSAFGWDRPEFCHLPLILGPDGKKLSKRHGDKYGFPVFPMTWDYVNEKGEDVHVTGFKHEGYEPDALINFLVLLGWNPGDNKEIMAMDEMISLFDLHKIHNAGAMFDIEKLKSFNAHYMRSRSEIYLFNNFIYPNIPDKDGLYPNEIRPVAALKTAIVAKERAVFAKDLYSHVSYFFEPVVLGDGVKLKNPNEFNEIMSAFWNHENDFDWTHDSIKSVLTELCEARGFKIGKILPDLRTALTGGVPGPELPLTMEILGEDESTRRIVNLLNKTEKVAG